MSRRKFRFSISDLLNFEDCRRKWLWSEHYGSRNPGASKPLWLGSGVHIGLQAYYGAKMSKTNPGERAIAAYEGWCRSFRKEFSSDYSNLSWTEIEGDEMLQLGRNMLNHYTLHDQIDPLEGDVIGVEQRIEVSMIDTPDLLVTLVGKIDLTLRRKEGIWIVDHKTTSDNSQVDFAEALQVDDQLTGYAYLYYRKYNVLPVGILYNVLTKSVPGPPSQLQRGGLSKSKDQKTTGALYIHEVKRLGLPLEEYEQIINYFLNEGRRKYFKREGGTRNGHELESFHNRALAKIHTMLGIVSDPVQNAWANPSLYRCTYCPFLGPCKAEEDGGDSQSVLASFPTINTTKFGIQVED